MSKSRYENEDEVRERIDFYSAKRDRNLQLARWCKLAGERLRDLAVREPDRTGGIVIHLIADANRAEEASLEFQRQADHEEKVTLAKLKAKLGEASTPPLTGITDATIPRK